MHEAPGARPQADEGRDSEQAFVTAVRALPWRAGRAHAFVHGEARAVMHGIRPYLRKERGVPRADASISGYWRRGRSEESFPGMEVRAGEGRVRGRLSERD